MARGTNRCRSGNGERHKSLLEWHTGLHFAPPPTLTPSGGGPDLKKAVRTCSVSLVTVLMGAAAAKARYRPAASRSLDDGMYRRGSY